jgi:hypothetical protein
MPRKTAKPHKPINVEKVIQIDIVTDGPTKGWVHTHGLAAYSRPELEIRNVPPLFYISAGAILNEVADYMLNFAPHEVVKSGEKMQIGNILLLRFEESGSDAKLGYDLNHYMKQRLEILGVELNCAHAALHRMMVKSEK